MISDAEQHRDEDRRLREVTDARNALDTAAYQVERVATERGDAVPVHEKARAENLVADARQALKDDSTPLDRLRSLTAELQQVYQSLATAGPGHAIRHRRPRHAGRRRPAIRLRGSSGRRR